MAYTRHPHTTIGGGLVSGAYRATHNKTGRTFWFVAASGLCPRRRRRINGVVVQLPQCDSDYECVQWALRIQEDVAAGRFDKDAYAGNLELTVADFYAKWTSELKKRRYAANTLLDWHYCTRWLITLHGHVPVALLKWRDIDAPGGWCEKYRHRILTGEVTPTTARKHLQRCKSLIALAHARGFRTDAANPFDGVQFRRAKKKQKQVMLTEETIRAAFEFVLERDLEYCVPRHPYGHRYVGNYVPMLVQFETVRRPGEVLTMEWSDLDAAMGFWFVRGKRDEYGNRALKRSQAEMVPLSKNAWHWLDWHREQTIEFGYAGNAPDENPWVFPTQRSQPSQKPTDRFRRTLKALYEANILPRWVTSNKWRHIASTMVEQTHGVGVATMMAGHTVQTKRTFYQLSDVTQMRDAAESQSVIISPGSSRPPDIAQGETE